MGLPVNPAKVEGHCKIGRDPINETFSNWLCWIAVIESTSVCITLGTTWWVGLSALMKTHDQFQEVYIILLLSLLLLLLLLLYIYIYIRSGPNNHDDHDSAIAEVSLWSKSGPKVAHRTAWWLPPVLCLKMIHPENTHSPGKIGLSWFF